MDKLDGAIMENIELSSGAENEGQTTQEKEAHDDVPGPRNDIDDAQSDHELELQNRIKTLEAEKLHLWTLLAHSTAESHAKTGPDGEHAVHETPSARSSQSNPPAPVSLMSLSTGSEESAIEDEKFVKIKPCEMESSSSKASSQSGKENLELEEQIHSLNEMLDTARKSLSEKEEECKEIKYKLEAILLEKNVESLSISSLSSDVKALKVNLVAKDEQMEEFNLVLDDLLAHFKTYLPSSESKDDGDTPLETKLNLLKCLPSQFHSLEQDGEGLARTLSETQAELKDLQDQQSEIIGGYHQMVTQNYEKLQADFEEYKLRVPEPEDNQQMKEELERFKEELLSKDEDLMEIQARCEEFEEQVVLKTKQVETLEEKLKKFQAAAKAAVKDAAASKAKLKDLHGTCDEYQTMLAQKVEALLEAESKLKDYETALESAKFGANVETEEPKQQDASSFTEFPEIKLESETCSMQSFPVDAATVFVQKDDKFTETEEIHLLSPEKEINESHCQTQILTLQNRCFEELRKQKVENQRLCQDAADLQNSDLVSQISSLETDLRQKDEALQVLHKTISANEDELREKEQALDLLRARLSQEIQLQQNDNEELKSLQNKITNYEIKLQEKEVEIENVRKELHSNEAQIHEKEHVLLELNTKISEKETAFQQKEDALDELQREYESNKNQAREANDAIEKLRKKLSLYEAQLSQSEIALRETENAMELARLEAASLGTLLGQKEEEIQLLRTELHEIQVCIETKTGEINETVQAKNLEIEQLMAAYQNYVDTKEKAELDLTEIVNNKSEVISRLESELDGLIHEREVSRQEQEEHNAMTKEQIESLQNYLNLHAAEIHNLTQEKVSNQVKLNASEGQFQELMNKVKSQEESIANAVQELSEVRDLRAREVSDFSAQLQILKSQAESHKHEASRLRSEHGRLLTQWQNTKEKAREEYLNKLKEEELLRESEYLLLQQQLSSKCEDLSNAENLLKGSAERVTQLLEDNSMLSSEIETIQNSTQTLQGRILDLEGEVQAKMQLELELRTAKSELEALGSLVAELEAKANQAEENLKNVEPLKLERSGSVDLQHEMVGMKEEIQNLKEEIAKKERITELLQSKITEIENSEMKAFEESFVLKNWIKRLEMENQRYQEEITMMINSATKDPSVHPKVIKIQEELLRLIYALDERDKRCVQLTVEITRLLEERDELQLKLSSVLKHNVELSMVLGGTAPLKSPIYDKKDLQLKLAQLEDSNFRMNIDLKREREARKLVQDELLYSQTARMYRERELKSRLSDGQLSAFSHSTLSPDSRPLSPESSGIGNPPISPRKENIHVVNI